MKVDRITEPNRFQDIAEEWNSFLNTSHLNCVFLTHEWFSAWWESLSGKNSLEVHCVRDDQETIIGIAPLMTDDRNLRFLASHEVTDYCDFLFLPDKKVEFFESLLLYLKENTSDRALLEFINIPWKLQEK